MRSVRPDDATARSRIRDAAILLFGREGFDKTSVRAIAEQARVSAALVVHHFGSKDALRTACDDYIVDELMEQKNELGGAELSSTLEGWLADLDQFRPTVDYLARMLTDGTAAGDLLFDKLVQRTRQMIEAGAAEGTMNASSDPAATAALVAVHSVGTIILGRQLGRSLGHEGLTDEVIRAITLPTMELYTYGLYSDDTILRATKQAMEQVTPHPTAPTEEDEEQQ